MQRIRSLALPAAISLLMAGACQDAPLAPRSTPPNAILTTDGATLPQILSHYEKFTFGTHDQYNTLPSSAQGEMTFIGDQGEIDLASLTVTPNTGTPFVSSGRIAIGAGDVVNCSDVVYGTCNQHHLSGVIPLSGAPNCNARASGTVSYWAAVAKTAFGFSWTTTSPSTAGTSATSVSVSAPVSATAAQCSTGNNTGGQSSTDSTTTTPGTGTVAPPPPPTGPNVPTAPPPPESPQPATGGGYTCQQTDLYEVYGGNRTLILTTIDCYRDT